MIYLFVFRAQLHRDAQGLWDKLLEHFVCLVKNRAMGTREVAYVFVPCLAHDSSQYQDKVGIDDVVTTNSGLQILIKICGPK